MTQTKILLKIGNPYFYINVLVFLQRGTKESINCQTTTLNHHLFKFNFLDELINKLIDTNTYPYTVGDRKSLLVLVLFLQGGKLHLSYCQMTTLNHHIFIFNLFDELIYTLLTNTYPYTVEDRKCIFLLNCIIYRKENKI